jgi:hypothetical protein
MVRVFLSYFRENREPVARLRQDLIDAGVEVWWDEDMLAGQSIPDQIRAAMRKANHVVVCFSGVIQQRERTAVYPEIRDAIKYLRERGLDSNYLIPVRLSECEIPDFEIDSTKTLRDLLHVDLFPEGKRQEGLQTLLRALGSSPSRRSPPSASSPILFAVSVYLPLLMIAGGAIASLHRWATHSPSTEVIQPPTTRKPAEDSPNFLYGIVVDSESGDAIKDAKVMIQDPGVATGQSFTEMTDGEGRFQFKNLRPGPKRPVRVHASKDDYEPSDTDPPLGTELHWISLTRKKRQ